MKIFICSWSSRGQKFKTGLFTLAKWGPKFFRKTITREKLKQILRFTKEPKEVSAFKQINLPGFRKNIPRMG